MRIRTMLMATSVLMAELLLPAQYAAACSVQTASGTVRTGSEAGCVGYASDSLQSIHYRITQREPLAVRATATYGGGKALEVLVQCEVVDRRVVALVIVAAPDLDVATNIAGEVLKRMQARTPQRID